MPRLGEFYGVAGEVCEHLAEVQRVSAQACRERGIEIDNELQSLAYCAETTGRDHLVEDVGQVELDVRDGELARFDLREIKNVVYDPKKRYS